MKRITKIIAALIAAAIFCPVPAHACGLFARMFNRAYYPQCSTTTETASPCGSCSSFGTCSDPCDDCKEAQEYKQEVTPEPCGVVNALERELVAEAVRVRGRALSIDVGLCQLARRNSALQAQIGSVGHYVGGGYEIAAPGRTPEEAVKAWLNSPAHRGILFMSFNKVGAGQATAINGVKYWTLRFSN